jgi:hypothetical protein
MPKEQLVAFRSLLKSLIELIELLGERSTQTLLVTNHLSFARIREDNDSRISQLNKLRLSAKVYWVLPLSPTEHVQITLQLSTVVSRYQDYGCVVGHIDQPVDPEIAFLNCGLVGCQVAVDHKEINARPHGICDKPFQALGGVSEVVIFLEMEITSVGKT